MTFKGIVKGSVFLLIKLKMNNFKPPNDPLYECTYEDFFNFEYSEQLNPYANVIMQMCLK